MHCTYVVRMVNTMLLTMGGYSFGYEIGWKFDFNATVVGFITAGLFFAYAQFARRICANNRQPVDAGHK